MRSELLATTLPKPVWLEFNAKPSYYHQPPTQTPNIGDDTIPFSEILLLLEELGTDAELAVETARTKLSGFEALLSFNIFQNSCKDTQTPQREAIPECKRLFLEGTAVPLPIQELPSHTPALKRKPHGLAQKFISEKMSSRQLAMEALVSRIRENSAIGKNPQSYPHLEQTKLRAVRKGAIEALVQRGWDMTQFNSRDKFKL